MNKITCSVAALLSASLMPTFAAAVTLTNGSGDGAVSIEVDLYGSSSYGFFDPVGPINGNDVIYDSEVFIGRGSSLTSLNSGYISDGYAQETVNEAEIDAPLPAMQPAQSEQAFTASIVSQSDTSVVSTFNVGNLNFTLSQSVSDAITDGYVSGSVLTQSYTISNIGSATEEFEMVRYFDGDIYLNDSSLADGGGVLTLGSQTILYETDATGNNSDSNTFVGITATGGSQPANYFSVQRCCGVNPYPLNNSVFNDTDGDGFIDTAYDVTLSLARNFTLSAGQTSVFTTQTLFGNAEPPAPGSTETLALLPDYTDEVNDETVYYFEVPVIPATQIVWIDPVIAIGYTYTVTGAEFGSVTMPTFGTVPDADGQYTVEISGMTYSVLAGGSLNFASLGLTGITTFTVMGIDTGLALDPLNPMAFPIGITLDGFTANSATVSQSPITINTTPSAVPLPASGLLFGGALFGLAGLRRRRKAASV